MALIDTVQMTHQEAGRQPPVLDLQLASLAYEDEVVLHDISLTVPRGQTLALVGPSGIGKSSLLRIFAGLEQSFAGHCRIDGKVAMVFQEPTLLPWRSVRDNVTIPTGVSGTAADALLADVGLADRADTFPNRLSLGQQRRLALARAFAVHPDLLLLDEPFVSLDPALTNDMMTLFARLRDTYPVTTILVTHVEEEARKLADRIVALSGAPARITSDFMNNA
ncbi:ABC transporter ATP-binding protein [Cognatiyoonia sp. IB215446]|uniref:ABC transporter ATP-binding protein n=1 Tax=Cognatiyoonia sp. IB215446 TaxID=3097355 RepID=UPI002A14F64A|nr:ABC transporter ATP-binding protein [Cognatiyoonia sp. IB215446]MDX8348936.1 ABC transporter ATP-binding protein [Cognatiyoonia sp. IB215446]